MTQSTPSTPSSPPPRRRKPQRRRRSNPWFSPLTIMGLIVLLIVGGLIIYALATPPAKPEDRSWPTNGLSEGYPDAPVSVDEWGDFQ